MYKSYANITYYENTYNGTVIPDDELEKALRNASRHIDSLTYNRIISQGISNLSEFQQEVIREVVCKQAEFEYENADLLNSVLSSYSINGVSMGLNADGWNVFVQNGVVMQRATYDLLKQTGLCCRSLGVF